MAVPAFRAAGAAVFAANNIANPTALTPTKGASTVNGDLMLLVTEARSITATVGTPTGWNLLTGFPKRSATASGGSIYVFSRIATGAAADAPTVTWTGLTTGTTGDSCGARILSYSGASTDQDGTVGVNDAASTTTITIPSITTGGDNSLVLGVAMRVNDTVHTFTVATFTERSDDHTASGTGHGTVTAGLVKTPAGVSGTAVVTPSNTTSSRTLAISLAVAALVEKSSAVSMSGGGTLTASGTKKATNTVTSPGGGVLASSGVKATTRTLTLAGGGVFSGSATTQRGSTALLTGGGAIGATGAEGHGEAVSISGGGSVGATGARGGQQGASISGGGALNVWAGDKGASGTLSVSGGGSLTVSGEAEETFAGASAAISLSGGGVISATALVGRGGPVSLTGGGSATASTGPGRSMSITLHGGGRIVALGGGGEPEWHAVGANPVLPGADPEDLRAVTTTEGKRVEANGRTVVYDRTTGKAYWAE